MKSTAPRSAWMFFVTFVLQLPALVSATTLGVTGGTTLAKVSGDLPADAKLSYHVGAVIEFRLGARAILSAGLNLHKVEYEFQTARLERSLDYISIPFHFLFEYPVGEATLVGGLGPYVAGVIGGHVIDDGHRQDLDLGNASGDDNPLDIGVDLAGGVQWNGLHAMLRLGRGLRAVVIQESVHNRFFELSVGWAWGRER